MVTSFALLDDGNASAESPRSRLYTGLQQVLSCSDASQFDCMMEQMQVALQQGFYAVSVLTYELGVVLQGLQASTTQASTVLIYRSCQKMSREQVADWLQEQVRATNCGVSADEAGPAGIAAQTASVDQLQFDQAINQIRAYIKAGDAYQVNYTYRIHIDVYGSLHALYQQLRERQPVPFGAMIVLPDASAILSLSPELFIRHEQGRLTACPMKGTAAASQDDTINVQRAAALAADPKNRAENVMIVDLLRNDLGRIACSGSVQVPDLFNVQRYSGVLQMTSRVTAQLREEVTLSELLRSLYPCGSITGAPKFRTMQLISELETQDRGVYTGAIGWFDPPALQVPAVVSLPDFCLSVPIRTLHVQAPGEAGLRRAVLGVGAGIVFDSVAGEEYQECQLKAQFLTGLKPQFSLFETMYASRDAGCRHLERHLQRLSASAAYFGVVPDLASIRQQLDLVCAGLAGNEAYRMKLSVDGTGRVQIQHAVLAPLTSSVCLMVSPVVRQSASLWLRHKTSVRHIYDQAWQEAERHGAFDMLFFNEHEALTEGGRCNVLLKLDGRWYTPPLIAGVLPGVMRSVLMADTQWAVTERNLSRYDLHNAQELAVCNALRGVLPAKLLD